MFLGEASFIDSIKQAYLNFLTYINVICILIRLLLSHQKKLTLKNYKKMTKNLALLFVLVVGLAFGQTKKVATSDVHWWGYKLAKTEASSHDGTVNVKSGAVVLKGNQLVGGTFVLDMTSISSTDLQVNINKN